MNVSITSGQRTGPSTAVVGSVRSDRDQRLFDYKDFNSQHSNLIMVLSPHRRDLPGSTESSGRIDSLRKIH